MAGCCCFGKPSDFRAFAACGSGRADIDCRVEPVNDSGPRHTLNRLRAKRPAKPHVCFAVLSAAHARGVANRRDCLTGAPVMPVPVRLTGAPVMPVPVRLPGAPVMPVPVRLPGAPRQ